MLVTAPYTYLTEHRIHKAIDSVCERSPLFRRWDPPPGCTIEETNLLYGIQRTGNNDSIVVTFYLAYSTWDGRILYVDRQHHGVSENPSDDVNSEVYPCLAAIAMELRCNRYV